VTNETKFFFLPRIIEIIKLQSYFDIIKSKVFLDCSVAGESDGIIICYNNDNNELLVFCLLFMFIIFFYLCATICLVNKVE